MNGFEYLKNHEGQFDLIIADSTYHNSVGKSIFSEEFYKKCKKCLNENGIFVNIPYKKHIKNRI